ncbi:MAG: hypothetical protein ACK5V3_06910 [Bdellovibrionales bacterium]
MLNLILIIHLSIANSNPTCQNVQLGVNAVLAKAGQPESGSQLGSSGSNPSPQPQAPTTSSNSVAKFITERDYSSESGVRSFAQDTSYLLARRSRGTPEEFNSATDKMIANANDILKDGGQSRYHPEAARAKAELFKSKYLKNGEAENLNPADMSSAIADLKAKLKAAGVGTFDDPPPELAAEKELLKKLEKLYAKTPEAQAEQQAALARARDSYRADQNQAENNFRASRSPAAQPFAVNEAQEIEQLTQTLRTSPQSLTPEQASKIESYRKRVREKQNWKEGQYSGLPAQDRKRSEEFAAALDQAASRMNQQNSGMINLAESQGRTVKLPRVEFNRPDGRGGLVRDSGISARGAAMARPESEVIMTDLRVANAFTDSRLPELVQFRPVVSKGSTMQKLESVLGDLGVTRTEIHGANVASTVDVIALEKLPDAMKNSNEFAQKIVTLSQQGKLQAIAEKLGEDGQRAVRELMAVARQHQRDYIPPHLRLRRFDE